MLQTVKKGSSLHVVGRAAARIGEAARFGVPCDTRERPSGKARRAVVRGETWEAAACERPRHREVMRCVFAVPARHER
ncbi:hypothetical protein KDW61_03420 [Burkholderia cenocepacia]|uniref:hypothetical protein n=1 Tax=Burkholderia cenocepacia TaxID=95486 RepID=UPI001B8E7E3C|nr:hypothetical protein [Burkholderia cenocepacia]MBR8207709.1 hypothetical protein [Burkholderia cenocepacia]